MNVISSINGNILKIIVQNLKNELYINEVLNLLMYENEIEISFLNLQIIPQEIILKLNKIKSRTKIYTNESVLKSYLMYLGFKVIYENRYKDNKKTLHLQYIVVGGSAGSLDKFIEIVKNLPKSNMSIFFIMHQRADNISSLASILQTYTKDYKVIQAQADMRIEEACIYTAPAGKHLIVSGSYILLSDEKKRNYSKPSISTSFDSFSNEYKNTFLAILVCGYGADGSDSLENLDKNSSTIIIEDPKDCEAKAILENAIKTNYYDHIYNIEDISKFIKNNYQKEYFTNEELTLFLEKIYKVYGYDYSNYNIKHIKRRVDLFYSILKAKNFKDFEKTILTNKNIFKDLFLNISVNVTTFYRNPEVFKKLKEEILPKLDSFMDIKIWCAGCSSGQEPYSIAIFLHELGLLNRSLIYATDLNEIILKNAKNAFYSKENYNLFLKNYYKAGGDESFSQYFNDYGTFVEVKDEIKEKILFFRHNLVADAKINDFQLIFCRNVLIYFNPKLKEQVFNLFHESLDSYGFLVLGESEFLDTNIKYKTIDKNNKIYKRKI